MRDKAFVCKILLPSGNAITAALLIDPALQTCPVHKDLLPDVEGGKMLLLHQLIGHGAGSVQICRHLVHGHAKDNRSRFGGRLGFLHGILYCTLKHPLSSAFYIGVLLTAEKGTALLHALGVVGGQHFTHFDDSMIHKTLKNLIIIQSVDIVTEPFLHHRQESYEGRFSDALASYKAQNHPG